MVQEKVETLTDARRKELREQFRNGQIPGVIATGTWGTAVDFPRLQFVFRVSAQSSEIAATQESGRAARTFAGKSLGIVLDTEDDFDKSMAARKNARLRLYRSKGWTIIRHKQPWEVPQLCRQLLGSPPPSTLA
jgi:superfamily II DNA or RNA helicase